jgi:Amt family ammonium transporter
MLIWMICDVFATERATLTGAINGIICGLVAITPAAGYVNGEGAILIGLVAGAIPWYTMNRLGSRGIFKRVDDTLGVFHTHAIAGAIGGLMTGLLADPHMLEYLGSKTVAASSVTGWFYGNPRQFFVQALALFVIVAYDGLATWGVLKLVGLVVPLRLPDHVLETGDLLIHGEVVAEDGDDGPEEDVEQDDRSLRPVSHVLVGWSLKEPAPDPAPEEIDA